MQPTNRTVTGDSKACRVKVEFAHEIEPDFSWLDQEEFKGENKADHIQLAMFVYKMDEHDDDWTIADTLGCIDFRIDGGDWGIDTYYRLKDIPKAYTYIRQLCQEAGLR